MFKKTKIAAATVALLSAAAMQNASAVAIDESGTNAQVLIFPYYNTNGSFITGFNIRNTKDEYKVVKMRFRESKLSNDVLDFNVYMSPYDHFSVGLSTNAAGHAVLSTADTTCTDPAIPKGGVELKGDVYTNTNFDDAREGYVEVIEIGNVKPAATVGATTTKIVSGLLHAAGVPSNCGVINAAWGTSAAFNANAMTDLSAPTGGLQGWSFLLDAAKGNANVAMPTAIRNYTTSVQHYRASDPANYLLPSLASGNDRTSVVMSDDGKDAVVTNNWAAATDYVTTTAGQAEIAPNMTVNSGTNPYPIAHVLAATGVSNDYLVTDGATAAGTDWVLTFPMRKHGLFAYQNATATAGDVTITGAKYFDREEATVTPVGGFSPVTQTSPEALPREVNIITFGKKGQPGTSVLGSKYAKPIGVDYLAGWGSLTISGTNKTATTSTTAGFVSASSITSGFTVQGVPVIGFAALRGNAPTNIIGESVPHVFTRVRGN